MTTFFMVRHASMDGIGYKIVGRERGIHLNKQGQTEANQLAARLAQVRPTGIYSSPMERAQDTAAAIARSLGLNVSTEPGLNEIDYGHWTGKPFKELGCLPEWQRYNMCRHNADIPGGESMPALVQRASQTVERLYKSHPAGLFILVSHADWIRAVAAHYAGTSLDALQKFDVCPASISILMVNGHEGRVTRWNDTGSQLALQ